MWDRIIYGRCYESKIIKVFENVKIVLINTILMFIIVKKRTSVRMKRVTKLNYYFKEDRC